MCLSVPKKVISIEKGAVTVEGPDGSRQVVKTIVELEAGDYVMTQQNVVVSKVDKKEAEEVISIFKNEEI